MTLLLAGAILATKASAPVSLPREFRGVWVATVDNIDWPSKPGLPVDSQKRELASLLARLARANCNAVVFQVRPNCDALYLSRLEPTSWYWTGQQGKSEGWDPLAFAVGEAHRLGMELHAWFNPFRAGHPAQKGPDSSDHVCQLHPDWVRTYGRYKWLDPGVSAARRHSLDVILDVVKRYDVDGGHIDDYFYPYPENGEFPDEETYAGYRGAGGNLGRLEWRRSNIDGFVSSLYREVKAVKPWVKVGISPFGVYRPGVPEGVQAGVDQFRDLAADALKWWRAGWCDYLSPQLYWRTDSAHQPFGKLLSWWASQNTRSRHLWPGLYTDKVVGKSGWGPTELSRQVALARTQGGEIHFSARSLLALSEQVRSRLYPTKALVPESPWLPSRPKKSG